MSIPCQEDRIIVLPFEDEVHYEKLLGDGVAYRGFLQQRYQEHPELFPDKFEDGFHFHGFRDSKKQPTFRARRIRLIATGEVYMVRPSFMLSYMRGKTDAAEKAMYLRRYGVPFSALTLDAD